MPGLNGYDTLKLIKQMGVDTQIIALTAQVAPGFREELKSKGFTDYLKKPFKAEVLLYYIYSFLFPK
jgi:CheY-like chemotaxis protein